MHITQKSVLFASLVLLAGMFACSGGSKGHDSASANLIQVTTQCDQGASINPTSAQVHFGDKPSFSIALDSGYSIQTIYCNSGGTLIGTQFTMGSVEAADNVHVVTTGRWVGAAAQVNPESTIGRNQFSAAAETSHVRSISATPVIVAKHFLTDSITVAIENREADVQLELRGNVSGHDVVVPLIATNAMTSEAHFVLGQYMQISSEDKLPNMLRFDIVEKGEGKTRSHGAILIAVRK